MVKQLLEFKHALLTRKVNYIKIPVTNLGMNDESMKLFNNIYQDIINSDSIHKLVFTKSGGISIARDNLRLPAYGIKKNSYCIELIILVTEGMWRLQFRALLPEDDDGKKISGHEGFLKFREICKDFDIDLADYYVHNGLEIKETITQPPVRMERESSKNKIFENVHHIDFHHSFPSGLANKHPEFRAPIQYVYNKRKETGDEIYKCILNFAIGYFQSKCWGAKLANLSKDAIDDNNSRIEHIAENLRNSDRVVLLYNTDGIWYQGDIYHDELEGEGLGQWSTDHKNCTFRMKSSGAYEYIEDGEYHPVVRGVPKDKSSKWTWGGIYSKEAEVVMYKFIEGEGIIRYEENLQ